MRQQDRRSCERIRLKERLFSSCPNQGAERQYDYDPAGRLARIDESGATAHLDDLRYNAHGQRFHAELPRAGNREVYHYDQQGRLIVEMAHSGDPVLREYVYLEGVPLAMLASQQVYYYHTDHLGTPKLLTDSNGAVVWQGEYNPFGEVTVTTGTVENPLRFPGQRADGSGTYYNYFRDYGPSIGRYIQSDPVGLRGGINTYGYVGQNPLRFKDPLGLDYRVPNTFDHAVRPPSFNNAAYDECMSECWSKVPKKMDPSIGDWLCTGVASIVKALGRGPLGTAVGATCSVGARQWGCRSDCGRPGITSLPAVECSE